MQSPLGELHTIDGKPVLRFERTLKHSPEKVWRAVTDPTEMAHWFPANVHTELRAGAPMQFSFGGDRVDLGSPYSEGVVLECDPPKVYAFRWYDSVLRFELIPDDNGCRLVFSHTMSGAGTWGDLPSVARQAPGWHTCLDALAAQLDGRPPTAGAFLTLAERYIEEFGLAEGTLRDEPDGYLVRFERDLVQPADAVWSTLTETLPAGGVSTPPRLLEYPVPDGGRVRVELGHQEPLGTRLIVTQTIPAEQADRRLVTLAEWHVRLELLYAALNGEQRDWPADRVEHLTEKYAKRQPASHR